MINSRKHFSLLLLLFFLGVGTLSLPQIANSQTVTGTVQGTVFDTNGAVVPGSTIDITNTETGLTRKIVTNDEGFYIAAFLPLGSYKAIVTKIGFGLVTRENITVSLNETTIVNFNIDPTVREAVVVTAEPPPINTTNAEIKGSLTEKEIQERPVLNQGNFLTLAETFTGFQENPTAGQNNPTASSGSSVNFNGTGTRGTTFQINGVNNDDSSENQNRQGASLATIKEFQVITNNFTAEFGRGYGAVVLVQTLSGTNNARGSVYLFHNDSALNAKPFFNHAKKPVNRRNQFGFTVGFPVIKNKLFSFISFDHTESRGSNTYTRDIFLPSERNPSNWFLRSPANNTPANRAFIQSVIDRFPSTLVPNDSRTPRTFVGEQGFDFPARDYSGRLDWNPRQSDNVFARWQYTRQRFEADDIIIGERADQNNKQQNIGVTWTHIFSAKTVGEFRYGLGLRTTLVNIAAGNNTPVIRFQNPNAISGTIIGNAGGFPIQRYQTDNQFVYNLSTLFGSNHFLKVGTDIRRQQLDDLADNFSRGFYNFTTACNGVTGPGYTSGFDAFLNGCISTFQKGFGPFFLENRINEYNFYVEDNWRVRPNLTINLGFRYEYVAVPREAKDRIVYAYEDDTNNYEPRIGFAYSPNFKDGFLRKVFGEQGKSSIRGGYGIYHGRIFQSVFSQTGAGLRFNPPQSFFYSVAATTAVNTNPLFNPNNLVDPTNGFVFTPGLQSIRHTETLVDPNLEMPYTQQWNLSFERQTLFNSAVRVSYTGNRGIGLLKFSQGNLPVNDANGVLVANHPNNAVAVLYPTFSSLPMTDPRRVDVRGQVLRPAADIQCAGTGLSGIAVNATCPIAVPIGPLEYSFRLPRFNERRPDGQFTTNSLVSNASWSYYHALQIELTKRLSHGLNFQIAYTFSHAIDTTSEATFLGAGDSNQNGNNARISRGYSRFHTPHRFTFFGTYRLPIFQQRRDFIGQALGGWQLSMVVKLSHGTPFTVINSGGVDLNLDGVAETRPVILFPDILGRGINNPNFSRDLLSRTAFRAATVADFGCCIIGRNTFYADGVKNVDLALSKVFQMPWAESHRLLVRADFFNAFNHVQFGLPNTDIASTAFGTITGTATQYTPRNVQISLKYQF